MCRSKLLSVGTVLLSMSWPARAGGGPAFVDGLAGNQAIKGAHVPLSGLEVGRAYCDGARVMSRSGKVAHLSSVLR
jgi:hypothetical protein